MDEDETRPTGWTEDESKETLEAEAFENLTGLTVEDRAGAMSALQALYRSLNAGRDDVTQVSVGLQRNDGVRFTMTLMPSEGDL